MGGRRPHRPRALVALVEAVVILLPLAIVLWWFLIRGRGEEVRRERPSPEAPRGEEAHPGAAAEMPATIRGFEEEVAARLRAAQPTIPAPEEPPPAPTGIQAVEEEVAARLRADQPPIPAPGEPPPVPTGIAALERAVSRRLAADRPRTAPLTGPGRVRILDVNWTSSGGRPFARADSIVGVVDAGAFNRGDIVVTALSLYDPDLVVERGRSGRLNLPPALARTGAERGAAGPRRAILFRDVSVRNGRLTYRTPGREILLGDLDAQAARVVLSEPGMQGATVAIDRLAAILVLSPEARRFQVAVEDGRFTLPDGRMAFAVGRIEVDESVLTDAIGSFRFDAPGLGLDATARVERLRFADLAFLVPDLPPEGVASFDLRITPAEGARSVVAVSDLVATADGSRVVGAFEVGFGGPAGLALLAVDLRFDPLQLSLLERWTGPLPYRGVITGRVQGVATDLTLDLTARLTAAGVAEPFTAGLTGRISLAGPGFAIRAVDLDLREVPLAAFRPIAPWLALRGTVTGRISLRGPPGEVPIAVDVALDVAGGIVVLAGTIDLTGAVPAYDLRGRLVGVQLRELLEPSVPPVALTARFSVVGRGLPLTGANARVMLMGTFTGWRAQPGDSILVLASLDRGTLDVDALALSLATADLSVAGRWRFIEPATGGLRYRLRIRSLEPFGPYIPIADGAAAGALTTSGTVGGSLDRIRIAGELTGAGLRVGAWAGRSVRAAYNYVRDEPLPNLSLRLSALDVEAPVGAYDTLTAAVDFAEPRFDVEIDAVRADGGGPVVLAAGGDVRTNEIREVLLRRFRLDLDAEEWTLERPALIQWGAGPGIEIRGLLIREVRGEGRIAIDGRYPPPADAELRVEVAALPIGKILVLLGREPVVTGDLWAVVRARGPANAPTIGADFRLVDGAFQGLALSRFEGAAVVEGNRLDVEVGAVLATAGMIDLDASIPVDVALETVPRIRPLGSGPIQASLVADSLSLSAISAVTPTIADAEGTLRARVTVAGTLDRPLLSGAVQVYDGAATITAVNRRYEEIAADIALEDRRAIIRELRARSDGWVTIGGTLTFAELTNPVLDVTIAFDEFRALGVDDLEPAAIWGNLAVNGPIRAPVVTGAVRVDDGNIPLPDLGGGPGPVAALASADEEVPLPEDGAAPTAPPTPWFQRIILDEVVVEAGNDLWLVSDLVRVQLSGELVLNKRDDEFRIYGTLEGERGTFTLRIGPLVRRFDIVRASVRFLGTPEPNPELEIVAARPVLGPRGEPTEIRLVIEGTANAPTVAVTTAEGTPVPESEVLSFLLFGRPSFALQEEAVSGPPFVEEALFGVGGLAELVSIELEEALVTTLGVPIDYFQIRPEPGPVAGFGAPSIVFGHQIAPELFLTVNAALGAIGGPAAPPAGIWSVTLEWRIDPEWTLELGFEPVYRGRFFRGLGATLPVTTTEQQFTVELRRRWTY